METLASELTQTNAVRELAGKIDLTLAVGEAKAFNGTVMSHVLPMPHAQFAHALDGVFSVKKPRTV